MPWKSWLPTAGISDQGGQVGAVAPAEAAARSTGMARTTRASRTRLDEQAVGVEPVGVGRSRPEEVQLEPGAPPRLLAPLGLHGLEQQRVVEAVPQVGHPGRQPADRQQHASVAGPQPPPARRRAPSAPARVDDPPALEHAHHQPDDDGHAHQPGARGRRARPARPRPGGRARRRGTPRARTAGTARRRTPRRRGSRRRGRGPGRHGGGGGRGVSRSRHQRWKATSAPAPQATVTRMPASGMLSITPPTPRISSG